MIVLRLPLLVVVALTLLGPAGLSASCQPEDQETAMFNETDTSEELARKAVTLASSGVDSDQAALRSALDSTSWLLRVNSRDEYARLKPEQLRLAGVLQALGSNPSPAATQTLAHISTAPAFIESETRQELLLREVCGLQPVPDPLVPFLVTQMTPESSNLALAVNLIVANGSAPAIGVFENAMKDPAFEPEEFDVWLRDAVLRHRQDVVLLEALRRLLEPGVVSAEVRLRIYEVLFDYRPDEWYPPDSDLPAPPTIDAASAEAGALLRTIAAEGANDPDVPGALRERLAHWTD